MTRRRPLGRGIELKVRLGSDSKRRGETANRHWNGFDFRRITEIFSQDSHERDAEDLRHPPGWRVREGAGIKRAED